MGREPLRLRHAEPAGGGRGRGRGDHRLLPGPYGRLQDPAHRRFRPAAEDRDGQDPEIRAARAGARAWSSLMTSHSPAALTASTPTLDIAYEVSGPEGGAPVILLHGWP